MGGSERLMSGRNSLPDPLTALRREAANWRRRCRAAEDRVTRFEAHICRLESEVAALRARLEELDPRERKWQPWRQVQKGGTG